MEIDLSIDEIQALRECLNYSKLKVREGSAPYEIKRQKLEPLDTLHKKLSSVIQQPRPERHS
jgi:predicted DNA-binding protein (UPF0251 family)